MNNIGFESFELQITEEIRIRIVDRKTAFAAKMLRRTIEDLMVGLRVLCLYVCDAELAVDGEMIKLNDVSCTDDRYYKVTYGGEKPKAVLLPADSKEVQRLQYLLRKFDNAKEISLKTHYFCERYDNSEIGLENFSEVLEVLDCDVVRENITYKCMEADDELECIRTYCCDKNHLGFVECTDDISAVRDVKRWEFDFTGTIDSDFGFDDEDNALEDKDKVEKIIEKITPYALKYGVRLTDSAPDCIEIEGFEIITDEKLDEFLDDLHSVNSILKEYNLITFGDAHYLVSREYGRFAVISFDVDEEGNKVREYRRF